MGKTDVISNLIYPLLRDSSLFKLKMSLYLTYYMLIYLNPRK